MSDNVPEGSLSTEASALPTGLTLLTAPQPQSGVALSESHISPIANSEDVCFGIFPKAPAPARCGTI